MRSFDPRGLGMQGLAEVIADTAKTIRIFGGRPECVVVDDYGHHCLDRAESLVGLPVKVREWANGKIHVMSTVDFERRESAVNPAPNVGAGRASP